MATKTAPKPKKNRHIVARTMPDGLKYWQCDHCQAKNALTLMNCPNCNQPRPNDVAEAEEPPQGQGLSKKTNAAYLNWVAIDTVHESASNNRRTFDEQALRELADSLTQHGMLAPLVVFPLCGNRLELIAGERRLRAAKMAGLRDVPVRILRVNAAEAHELRLIENMKREDLDPIEEAIGYQQLLDVAKITQAQLGERLGISQSKISNRLRLLKLPEEWQQLIITRAITEHHARPLLPLVDKPLALRAIYESLTSDVDGDGNPVPVAETMPSTRDWPDEVEGILIAASSPCETGRWFSAEDRREDGTSTWRNGPLYLTAEQIAEHAEELQLIEVPTCAWDPELGRHTERMQVRAMNRELLLRLNDAAAAQLPVEETVGDEGPDGDEPDDSEEPASPAKVDSSRQRKELTQYLASWYSHHLFARIQSGKVPVIPLTRMLLFAISRRAGDDVLDVLTEFEQSQARSRGKAKPKASGCFPGIGDGHVIAACAEVLKPIVAAGWANFSLADLVQLGETAGIDFEKEWQTSPEFLTRCDAVTLAGFQGANRSQPGESKGSLVDQLLKAKLPKKPPQILLDLLKDDSGE